MFKVANIKLYQVEIKEFTHQDCRHTNDDNPDWKITHTFYYCIGTHKKNDLDTTLLESFTN